MATLLAALPEAGKFGPPVRECIYSTRNDPHSSSSLTIEHIIPEGLGGKVELLGANCETCRNSTSKIEGIVLREQFQQLRQLLKLGRLRKPQPFLLARAEGAVRHSSEWTPVESGEYPLHAVLPVFYPPGLLVGRARHTVFAGPGEQAFMRLPRVNFHNVGDTLTVPAKFHPVFLARLVAKIAHGACVALMGRGSFDPLLPQAIIGGYPFLPHLVGSPAAPVKPLLTVEDMSNGPLHEVTILQHHSYFVAHVRLFAKFGFLGYQVVVGRAK